MKRSLVDAEVEGRWGREADVDADRHGCHVDVDHGYRGVVRAGVAVGTRVLALPAGCSKIVVGGIVYQNCGGVYYKPCYEGTTVVYIVVDAP